MFLFRRRAGGGTTHTRLGGCAVRQSVATLFSTAREREFGERIINHMKPEMHTYGFATPLRIALAADFRASV